MASYDIRKINVLIIEKHHLMRRLMADVMHTLGVEKVEALSVDALEEEGRTDFKPDVIFTDWSPGCDAIELIRQIRNAQKENCDRYLPIVMVSAFTEVSQVCKARDAGITEFLAKPVTASLIYRRLCAIVENPRDFVQTNSFFGPDRRRRNMGVDGSDRRKNFVYPQEAATMRNDLRAVPA